MSLDGFKGRYVVLIFYPQDFTYICPTEMLAFADKAIEFEKKANCAILACSTDSIACHRAWMKTPKAQWTILPLS